MIPHRQNPTDQDRYQAEYIELCSQLGVEVKRLQVEEMLNEIAHLNYELLRISAEEMSSYLYDEMVGSRISCSL